MQLSLRTLLAFADDIYDPQSRQQVMQRIKEHPTADAALQKVLDVVRCDTFAVPGNELDPNLVAAYLDYLLSDDEVYRFEMLACQSEVYLAEVASVHHLLNVVFGRPARISSELRQQLYRIPVKESLSSVPEYTFLNDPKELNDSFHNQRHAERFIPGRPHLNELLESYKKNTHTKIWKITLSCIILFVAVFYLHMLFEPSQPEATPPRPTAVPVATLMPEVSNNDYFQENRDWANPPTSPPPSSVAPSLPIAMPSSMPIPALTPSIPTSETLVSESSGEESLQNAKNPVAYISQVQPLAPDNPGIFYPSQYALPQPLDESVIPPAAVSATIPVTSPVMAPVTALQSPPVLDTQPDVQQSTSIPTPGHHSDSYYTTLNFTPVPSVPEQKLQVHENPLMSEGRDFLKEEASHDVAMEVRYDSHTATSRETDAFPDVVFSTPETYYGSLMQISSVSHVPPAPLIQQSNISLDESDPKPVNKMDVKYFGDAPNINEIFNRPLPPLIPNHEKKKSQSGLKEPETSFDENHINRAIAPVSYQKQDAVFSERMKITTLRMPKNNLAFVAKDENSLWERAIDEKSLSGEFLLVPAPFTAAIHAGNGVKLTIAGDTRLNVLTDTVGINFDYGHIRIEVEQDAIFPVSYTIKTPQGDGTLTFFSPNTKVHLTSLSPESQEYVPQLLVFPKEGDSVIWTPGKAQLQLKIDVNSKILFGTTLEESIVPLAKDFDEKSIATNSNFMDENLKQTGLKLYSRIVTGATLESVLEELISDPSENVVALGARWCAELGRIDIPFIFLSVDNISPTVHKHLNDYLSEVKLRDPETVSKMELAEKSALEP